MTASEQPNGTISVRPFVPATNLEVSIEFYRSLGFEAAPLGEALALLTIGETGFLLQQFQSDGFAQNYMLQLTVADLDTWWERLVSLDLASSFGISAPIPPVLQPWGTRVAYVFDPSGVLWHLTEAQAK